MRRLLLALVVVLLWPGAALAQEEAGPKPCEIKIQFYNLGSPANPTPFVDHRYGVQIVLDDGRTIVVPPGRNDMVSLWSQDGQPIPVQPIRPYVISNMTGEPVPPAGGSEPWPVQAANCGLNQIQVPAGA